MARGELCVRERWLGAAQLEALRDDVRRLAARAKVPRLAAAIYAPPPLQRPTRLAQGCPSGPERSALAAWMPTRSYGAVPGALP